MKCRVGLLKTTNYMTTDSEKLKVGGDNHNHVFFEKGLLPIALIKLCNALNRK
jgi:hypothetical protein